MSNDLVLTCTAINRNIVTVSQKCSVDTLFEFCDRANSIVIAIYKINSNAVCDEREKIMEEALSFLSGWKMDEGFDNSGFVCELRYILHTAQCSVFLRPAFGVRFAGLRVLVHEFSFINDGVALFIV